MNEPWKWMVGLLGRDKGCLMRGRSRCETPLQGAHIISKHHLKKYGHKEHLWDTRNGFILCYRHHRRHDSYSERVPRALLPEGIKEFTKELGIEHLLERQYP